MVSHPRLDCRELLHGHHSCADSFPPGFHAMTLLPHAMSGSGKPCASGSKLGLVSFGGPPGRSPSCTVNWWSSGAGYRRRFLHALNYCMLLPGPEGAAVGHLYRLAHAPHAGWRGGGRTLCAAFARADRLELDLCGVRAGAWVATFLYGVKTRHGRHWCCRRCTASAAVPEESHAQPPLWAVAAGVL